MSRLQHTPCAHERRRDSPPLFRLLTCRQHSKWVRRIECEKDFKSMVPVGVLDSGKMSRSTEV